MKFPLKLHFYFFRYCYFFFFLYIARDLIPNINIFWFDTCADLMYCFLSDFSFKNWIFLAWKKAKMRKQFWFINNYLYLFVHFIKYYFIILYIRWIIYLYEQKNSLLIKYWERTSFFVKSIFIAFYHFYPFWLPTIMIIKINRMLL